MEDRISVIVPCYNIEALVGNTVKTILNQSYRNLEIILVDDGSKDGTLEIINQLADTDNRIKVIHKENGGVTRARLTGVMAATGEWIGFVDGDDAIEPDMYEVLLHNAHRFHADISHCGYQMVFPSRVDYYYNTGRLVEQDWMTGLKDLLSGSFIEPGLWNKLFHRSLFDKILHEDIMDYSIKINEDLLMNYYLFKEAGHSVFIDKCYYHYMVREGSAATSKISENKLRDPVLVQKIIRNDTADYQELQMIINERLLGAYISIATMSLKEQPKLIEPYRTAARRELRKMLGEIIRGSYSMRIKILAVWASIWPFSYRLVHLVYAYIRGTDRKYEVS